MYAVYITDFLTNLWKILKLTKSCINLKKKYIIRIFLYKTKEKIMSVNITLSSVSRLDTPSYQICWVGPDIRPD